MSVSASPTAINTGLPSEPGDTMNAVNDTPTDWLDPEEQQVWYSFAYLMMRLPGTLDARMQADAGITHYEFLVLLTLFGEEDRTLRMSVLADLIASSLPRLSNVAGRMEAKHWLQRRPDPTDGRYTLATLSDEGAAVVRSSMAVYNDEVRRVMFAPLTKAQQRSAAQIARRMLSAIDPTGACAQGRLPGSLALPLSD